MGFTEVNYSFQKREKYLQEVVHSSGGRHSQVKKISTEVIIH